MCARRNTQIGRHLPSSVFEPVAVVETVIDVDVDPLVEARPASAHVWLGYDRDPREVLVWFARI